MKAEQLRHPKPRRQLPLVGMPVTPGIAIGPVAFAAEPKLEIARQKISASDVSAQLHLLDDAVTQARKQLTKLRARLANLPEESEAEIGPLLDAHLHMLGSSRLLRMIRTTIEDRLVTAATAVLDVTEAQAAAFFGESDQKPEPGDLARQAEEVREFGRRLLRNLIRLPFRSFVGLPHGSVLLADALRPADAALIEPTHFAGIAAEEGGDGGHTAVMLRALGIPAVLGVNGLVAAAREGSTVIVDGEAGVITLNPGRRSLAAAARQRADFTRAQRTLGRLRRLPSETTDHVLIELQANLELPFELPMVARSGAAGIGLMRSEFLFMNRETLPDEDAQFRTYREVVEAMDGDPVTIRLLDWGSEKEIDSLSAAGLIPETHEVNPALGLRGVRLLNEAPDLLVTQIAAIIRASLYGPVRLLVPMVCRTGEIALVRDAMSKVWRQRQRLGQRLPTTLPPLGIMVETPAAAVAAVDFARQCDFFAIGTNDLAMYTLAADRNLPPRYALYDALEPAVLRLISMTVTAADAAGIPVSLCGELANRPEVTQLLIGLGLRQLSMHGGAVLRVKRAVRASTRTACDALAADAIAAPDALTVHMLLDAHAAV